MKLFRRVSTIPNLRAQMFCSTSSHIQPVSLDHKRMVDDMIRVDHAGEFGAVRIYEGQVSLWQLKRILRMVLSLQFFVVHPKGMLFRLSLTGLFTFNLSCVEGNVWGRAETFEEDERAHYFSPREAIPASTTLERRRLYLRFVMFKFIDTSTNQHTYQ